MCNKCKEVSIPNINARKREIDIIINNVKFDFFAKFNDNFESKLVGSAKRNLVYSIKGQKWDLDYQLLLSKRYDAKIVREWFFDTFKKYAKGKYNVVNSKSVIYF